MVVGVAVFQGITTDQLRRLAQTEWAKMASGKKSGNGSLEKGVNGRRSSKHKEVPIGEKSTSVGM